jgi:hypothetical protein
MCSLSKDFTFQKKNEKKVEKKKKKYILERAEGGGFAFFPLSTVVRIQGL